VHPNVLSGDSYLLSGEFTGLAERLLEAEFGGSALFTNGAQGSIDVDGHGPRDWDEMERLGRLLAASAAEAARAAALSSGVTASSPSRRGGMRRSKQLPRGHAERVHHATCAAANDQRSISHLELPGSGPMPSLSQSGQSSEESLPSVAETLRWRLVGLEVGGSTRSE
jgi:hypothetical protein